jgi:hypothetical protein
MGHRTTARIGIAAALAIAASIPAIAQTAPELLLFGGEDHKTFLGCLNCNQMSPSSVWNDYSQYGFKNQFAIWNPFGPYKNPYGSESACNDLASDPPVIVDRQGNFYGRFSVNELAEGSVCGVRGNENTCMVVRAFCADA